MRAPPPSVLRPLPSALYPLPSALDSEPSALSPQPYTRARLHASQTGPGEQVIEPDVRQLLLHRVLPQPRRQIWKVDPIQLLILVEAREDDRFRAGARIDVLLQALRADFLHHALHRRVDAADADVIGLEI